MRAKETKEILEAIGIDPQTATKEEVINTILGWKNNCKESVTVVNITDQMGFTQPHTFNTLEEAEDFVIEFYGAEDKLQTMDKQDALYEIGEDLGGEGCGESYEIV